MGGSALDARTPELDALAAEFARGDCKRCKGTGVTTMVVHEVCDCVLAVLRHSLQGG